LKIRAEGWQVLCDAQSALAHSCIVMYFVKSAKLEFMFKTQKGITQGLQQKFEEEWTSTNLSNTVVKQMASAVRDLRLRLKDYLLLFQTEIIPKALETSSGSPTPSRRESRSPRQTIRNSKEFAVSFTRPVTHLLEIIAQQTSGNASAIQAFGVDSH
jgi:hypothetical protein